MKRPVIVLFAISLGIAGFISWFASTHPDGLEYVAIKLGFGHTARAPEIEVLPDYSVPGLPSFLSNSAAGIIGTIAVFGLVMLIGFIMARRRHRE